MEMCRVMLFLSMTTFVVLASTVTGKSSTLRMSNKTLSCSPEIDIL